jgi:EpsI family protein
MKLSLKNSVLLVLMVIAAALGSMLRPTISLADERPPIDLKAMVPTSFGEWHEEANMQTQVVNPQQKEMIDRTYSQTLSRTYINAQGYRIMLSIAYGKNQSDALQLHRPESCYPAQGFVMISRKFAKVNLLGQSIAATQLETSMGQRFEPITYWAVVGDNVTTLDFHKKIAELRYALHNRIPDGMLVRVSSIDQDTSHAYAAQSQFANAMAQAVAPENRLRFVGINRKLNDANT